MGDEILTEDRERVATIGLVIVTEVAVAEEEARFVGTDCIAIIVAVAF